MTKKFMQLATLAMAVFLLSLTSRVAAQTQDSAIIMRVLIDGVATDYFPGNCGFGAANWGGSVTSDLCSPTAWGYDITPDSLACDSIPAGQLTGKVALVRRGTCGFSIKALNAQKAGAVAVLVAQIENAPTTDDCFVMNMGATQPQAGLVTVPVLFLSRVVTNKIDAAQKAGKSVQVCFVRPDVAISSFFFPASHIQTPESVMKFDTFGFSANLSVPGSVNRTNIVLTAKVKKLDGTELFTSSVTIPSLAAGVVDSFIVVPGSFVPNLPQGGYRITYSTRSDAVAGLPPVQDTVSGDFFVTENVFANDNGATNGFRPGTVSDYAVGAVYSLPADLLEQYSTKQVEFAFATNATDYPVTDVDAALYLFRINDDILPDYSNFDGTELFSPSMTWLGLGSYGPSPDAVGYALQQVDIADFNTGELGIALQAGSRYMVVAGYTAPHNLTFQAFDTKVDLPGISTTVYTTQWFLGGFGAGTEAVLRMNLDLVSRTDEKQLPLNTMQVMPNPVVDNLNLVLQFDQPTDATITIADITGRVINFETRKGLLNETLRYPVTAPNGTYIARIATKNGTLTKKFVVQK